MDARQSRRARSISRQQEKRAASDLGGKTQAASGATRLGGGGDVRVLGKVRVECKITELKEYTLKFAELEKLRKQAVTCLEFPVLQFAFLHKNGRAKRYAVIPWPANEKPEEDAPPFFTSAKQMKLAEGELDKALQKSRLQLTFIHAGPPPQLDYRLFEIMHWDDFVSRWNTQQEG